jgi:hypothetical protein
MRMKTLSSVALFLAAVVALSAGQSEFLGRWNLTGTGDNADVVYWLEVKEEAGALAGMFLNRTGSPVPLESVKVENGELVFQLRGRGDRPGAQHRARVEGGRLIGSVTGRGRTINWVGVRPPAWGPLDANASHKMGRPVELFDGQSLEAFGVQHANRPMGWSVVDGVATNEERANNLVSKQKFLDFHLQAEYKLDTNSNSGIYLRGRHELQVLDDHGKPVNQHAHMSIYGWTPPALNASKPAGEWQTMEATVLGNRVTVVLNGQKVHDNTRIEAITGGALDSDEAAPGPIMIQGDHSKVWFRKLTVTPIMGAPRRILIQGSGGLD